MPSDASVGQPAVHTSQATNTPHMLHQLLLSSEMKVTHSFRSNSNALRARPGTPSSPMQFSTWQERRQTPEQGATSDSWGGVHQLDPSSIGALSPACLVPARQLDHSKGWQGQDSHALAHDRDLIVSGHDSLDV